jgi:hypothetical protein
MKFKTHRHSHSRFLANCPTVLLVQYGPISCVHISHSPTNHCFFLEPLRLHRLREPSANRLSSPLLALFSLSPRSLLAQPPVRASRPQCRRPISADLSANPARTRTPSGPCPCPASGAVTGSTMMTGSTMTDSPVTCHCSMPAVTQPLHQGAVTRISLENRPCKTSPRLSPLTPGRPWPPLAGTLATVARAPPTPKAEPRPCPLGRPGRAAPTDQGPRRRGRAARRGPSVRRP